LIFSNNSVGGYILVDKQQNEIVKKSNALIRSHWVIESVLEPRIVAVLASKVNVKDEDFKIYEIPAVEILGSKYGGHDMKELASVVDNIMGRVLTIYDSNGKGWTKYNVFSRCRFRHKDAILELRFDADLKPHYLQLKERFTQYSLAEFMSLSSVYSQRLYEILKSWSDKLEVTLETSELYDILEVPKSFRRDFGGFRRKVLEQAYKDIADREGSSLWFDWEPIKQGRGGKVVAIRFVFSKDKAKELAKNQTPPDEMYIHQQMQRQSNGCFERLTKQGKKCTPKLRTAKCRFCTTRGRMYAKGLVDESQGRFPLGREKDG
jgi:plasmid replication initiation protein